MKKAFRLLLLLLFPLVAFSQKIKSDTVDAFTNERNIETTIVTLKQGYSTGFGVSYTAQSNSYYLNIIGYGVEEKLIDEDDKLWFVLEDGSVVKFETRLNMPSNDSEFPNLYIHHYTVKAEDVEVMKNNKLMIVRIVHTEGLNDVNISKKSSKNFAKLNDIFLNAVSR